MPSAIEVNAVNSFSQTTSVLIDDDTNFVDVCRIPFMNRVGMTLLYGEVGEAGGIGDIEIQRSIDDAADSEFIAWLTDFSALTDTLKEVSPKPGTGNPFVVAAGGTFFLKINAIGGALLVRAKKATAGANTTLRIKGLLPQASVR